MHSRVKMQRVIVDVAFTKSVMPCEGSGVCVCVCVRERERERDEGGGEEGLTKASPRLHATAGQLRT